MVLVQQRGWSAMTQARAIGIDLGTTYSCIAWLNEHGQPVTLPNQEGELSTPSVVFFDEQGQTIVGTEALRNAIASPQRVVQHAKRHMGDGAKFWKINDYRYSAEQISSLVLKKLLDAAQEQIGEEVERLIRLVQRVYGDFGLTFAAKLSTRPDEFLGEVATWDHAEAQLRAGSAATSLATLSAWSAALPVAPPLLPQPATTPADSAMAARPAAVRVSARM